jgi:hypothetical protein
MQSIIPNLACAQFHMIGPSLQSVILCKTESSCPQVVHALVGFKWVAARRSLVGTMSCMAAYHEDVMGAGMALECRLSHSVRFNVRVFPDDPYAAKLGTIVGNVERHIRLWTPFSPRLYDVEVRKPCLWRTVVGRRVLLVIHILQVGYWLVRSGPLVASLRRHWASLCAIQLYPVVQERFTFAFDVKEVPSSIPFRALQGRACNFEDWPLPDEPHSYGRQLLSLCTCW